MKTQNTFKVSDTGWLCIEVKGRWIPACKLNDAQLADVRETLAVVPTVQAADRPAYYDAEGGSMCNGIGRDYIG